MLESMTTAAGTSRSLEEEYRTLTEGCGLLDRSQRGKLALTGAGAGAAEFLNGQVTNDVRALAPGEGCYAAFLTHKGKMLGDLRVLVTEDELLLDTERVALQALFDMIRRFSIGYDAQLHKRTLETALLSLIGPEARAVAASALDGSGDLPPEAPHAHREALDWPDDMPPERPHAHREATIADRPVRLISAGPPSGIDVLCATEDRKAVHAALLEAGAREVAEQATEIVRVELGIPRYGIDLDETVIPQEAGLNERAVSFTKGCYVGQETVARLHYRGKPNRHLRGLKLPPEPSPMTQAGTELRLGDRAVGHVGSAVVSPRLGRIGLALLRREAQQGSTVAVGDDAATAVVVELPFG
jgi:folate-binding protein YgfZ